MVNEGMHVDATATLSIIITIDEPATPTLPNY
jgi:hypothetical protein